MNSPQQSSIALNDLRPDLRIVGIALADDDPVDVVPDQNPSSLAEQLALLRSDARLVSDDTVPLLSEWLESQWSHEPVRGSLRDDVTDLVLALSVFDEVCRDRKIFSGNVYLASEDAVDSLLKVAGCQQMGSRIGGLLSLLQFAELMYRFPVAFKFRGVHGSARQCRLNGWGRLLATRIAAQPWATERSQLVQAHITEHLTQYGNAYAAHLSTCLHAIDDGEHDEWDASQLLPVPVLT